MTRIAAIGTFVPETGLDNFREGLRFDIDQKFIRDKIGFTNTSRKAPGKKASDLCLAAWHDLKRQVPDMPPPELVLVCTQNPDQRIPHTAMFVHQKLGLPESCDCMDISLGCSGYVSTLSLAVGYMRLNSLRTGLVFTADPYSEILDPGDRNTWLLFGDAATVTLLRDEGELTLGPVTSVSVSGEHGALSCPPGGVLYMDGRRIFNFAMRYVPRSIDACLKREGLRREDVDVYLLHQASGYLVENLRQRLGIPKERAPFEAEAAGNTVSSTLPMLLKNRLTDKTLKKILLCGFGVGLSVATALMRRS